MIPVGTPSYVESLLKDFMVEQRKLALDLMKKYQDKQTVAQAYRKGVMTKLPYRLIVDMVRQVNLDFDLSTWSTQFTADVNALTQLIVPTLSE